MRKVFLLIGLLALAAVSGCESRRTVARLDDIQSFLQDRPDSALTALRSIPESELSSKRLRARYSLLNAMALHKCYIDTADLSVIAPADRYYARHGSAWDKMKTLHQKGIIQMNGGDYQSAVISLTAAANYIDQAGDWFNGGLICISLCQLYNKLHDNNEELSWAIRAENYYQKVDKPIYYQDSRIKHAIALNNLGRYQEAVDIYHSLLDDEELDEANRLSAMAHLAHTQIYRQYMNPREADSLFTLVIQKTGRLPHRQNWGAYAYASDLVGKRERADRIYAQLDTNNKDIFGWYSRSLYERGEYQNAFDHLSLSIASQTQILNVALTQAAHKSQRDHAENLRLIAERKLLYQRVLYPMAMIVLFLVALVIILQIRHRYNQLRAENINLSQVASHLARQLAASRTASKDEREIIRREYINKYQATLQKIGLFYENILLAERNQDKEYRELKSALATLRKRIEEDTSLEKVLDASLDGVMTQFHKDFPGLASRDYQMMSFIIAGFDATTIAVILDAVSIDSVRMKKMRLKKMIMKSIPEIANRYVAFF